MKTSTCKAEFFGGMPLTPLQWGEGEGKVYKILAYNVKKTTHRYSSIEEKLHKQWGSLLMFAPQPNIDGSFFGACILRFYKPTMSKKRKGKKRKEKRRKGKMRLGAFLGLWPI